MNDGMAFDVHYGYWFNLACERFYRRIDFATNFVKLVGGSGAALAAINGEGALVVASGLLLAVCAAIAITVQPAVKAEQHLQAKCRYLAIKGRLHALAEAELAQALAEAELAQALAEAELAQALAEAQSSGPAGIGALATPAFNSTLHATGRTEGFRPLSWRESLAAFMA